MIVVLSGEGPTDLGECAPGKGHALFADIRFGPLAVMMDRLTEPLLGSSLHACEAYRLIDKSELATCAKTLKASKKLSPRQ